MELDGSRYHWWRSGVQCNTAGPSYCTTTSYCAASRTDPTRTKLQSLDRNTKLRWHNYPNTNLRTVIHCSLKITNAMYSIADVAANNIVGTDVQNVTIVPTANVSDV